MNPGPKSARGRCAALAVTLVALLVRVIVPAGFMLATDARAGGVTVTICTGSGGLQTAVLTPDGVVLAGHHDPVSAGAPGDGAGADRDSAPAHAPCVAAGAVVVPPAGPGAVLANAQTTATSTAARLLRADEPVPGRGLAAPPPPATAPPLTV